MLYKLDRRSIYGQEPRLLFIVLALVNRISYNFDWFLFFFFGLSKGQKTKKRTFLEYIVNVIGVRSRIDTKESNVPKTEKYSIKGTGQIEMYCLYV